MQWTEEVEASGGNGQEPGQDMSSLLSLHPHATLSFFILSRNMKAQPGWRWWVPGEVMCEWSHQSDVGGDAAFIGRRWNRGGGNITGPQGS